jgi:hypothetical protein
LVPTNHIFTYSSGHQPFHGKRPHPLLSAGSRAARAKVPIRGIRNRSNCCVIFTLLLPFGSLAWPARCRWHEVLSSLGLLRGGNSAPALTSPVGSIKQVITMYTYLLIYL